MSPSPGHMLRKDLIEKLCFGDVFRETSDNFFESETAAPNDEIKANLLLQAVVPYRSYQVPLAEFCDPQVIPPGLRKNWLFVFHSLGFVESLRRQHNRTGRPEYLKTYVRYLEFWLSSFG